MSILTLLHSVRALRWIFFKAFTLIPITFACFATAYAFGQTVSKADATRAQKYSIDAIRGASELPNAEPKVKIQKQLRWVLKNDEKILVVPITIRYVHLSNSYCRLITISKDFQRFDLVQISPEANFDNCKSISAMFYLDINGDRRVDIVQGLNINSNRYDTNVMVPIVYLSDETTEGGYCFSDLASRELKPLDLTTAERTEEALKAAKQRLMISRFKCSK